MGKREAKDREGKRRARKREREGQEREKRAGKRDAGKRDASTLVSPTYSSWIPVDSSRFYCIPLEYTYV